MIVSNKIRCKKCNTIIESKNRHDFVTCPCGECSVDGGRDYLKRSYKTTMDNYEDLSECMDDDLFKRYFEESIKLNRNAIIKDIKIKFLSHYNYDELLYSSDNINWKPLCFDDDVKEHISLIEGYFKTKNKNMYVWSDERINSMSDDELLGFLW